MIRNYTGPYPPPIPVVADHGEPGGGRRERKGSLSARYKIKPTTTSPKLPQPYRLARNLALTYFQEMLIEEGVLESYAEARLLDCLVCPGPASPRLQGNDLEPCAIFALHLHAVAHGEVNLPARQCIALEPVCPAKKMELFNSGSDDSHRRRD